MQYFSVAVIALAAQVSTIGAVPLEVGTGAVQNQALARDVPAVAPRNETALSGTNTTVSLNSTAVGPTEDVGITALLAAWEVGKKIFGSDKKKEEAT